MLHLYLLFSLNSSCNFCCVNRAHCYNQWGKWRESTINGDINRSMGHLSELSAGAFCFLLHHATALNSQERLSSWWNVGCSSGRPCSRNRSRNQGLRSLKLSGLGTVAFACTQLIVDRAVISCGRRCTPFEARSLHPAMCRRIHGLSCPSSTA